MTLIEISIALLILGLLLLIAVPSMEAVTGVKAREETGRISGAVRYLYSASALYGKVCRLVFDLDQSAWWAECTGDRFTVGMERSLGGERVEELDRGPSRSTSLFPEDEAIREKVEKRATFSEYTSEEVERRTLPNGAQLAVWSAHQTEKYTKGTAYLYFFPQGYTEKARIWVSSGHGDTYTISVSPLNGRVSVVGEELEVPRG